MAQFRSSSDGRMLLTAGSRVGCYEVVAALGSGGMGEVYRARDTKLDRDVAIKVLPEVFATDVDRVARLIREAKTLAALNHPNIAAIYGLEESTGVSALVLELVEGPTLADRISRGNLPLEEALPIARQIAEALEAAHDRGIVHRDLKPANVKLRSDSAVKVLDFGLAKALEGAAAAPSSILSMSPTQTTPAMTSVGLVLGTPAYMSPEQAKGKEVDKRADVWAFGCVLYEMLTGVRAFGGAEIADTLASVITTEPDWNALPAATPPSIRQLLRRCLQKDLKDRLRDVGDARLQILDSTLEDSSSTAPAPMSRADGRARERIAWISALVVTAIGAVATGYFGAEPRPSEMRLEVSTPPTIFPNHVAISPDGRRLAFIALHEGQSRLWVRPLDSTTPMQPLPATGGAMFPFWSPDSRSLGFFAQGKLKVMDIGGRSPRVLANAPSHRGGTWLADGTIVFAPAGDSPLFRVPSSAAGDAVPATTLNRHVAQRFPSALPVERKFLFYAAGPPNTAGIYIGSLDSPEVTRLTAADSAGVFAPPDWLLFVRQGALVAQHIDVAAGVVSGDLVTLAGAVTLDGFSNVGAVSASATGIVVYRWGAVQRQLVWFDRSGNRLGALGPRDGSISSPSLSPDGQRVAVHRTVDGNTDIWIIDAARTVRQTFDAGADLFPLWSPDGRTIVFDSNRKDSRDLYQLPANSPGSEKPLFESLQGKAANDWSRNGFLLFTIVSDRQRDRQTNWDLSVLPLDGSQQPSDFLKTPAQEGIGQFSPDGRWVAYQSFESGSLEVYVRPFPGPGPQQMVSTEGGGQARWSSDGKKLYYLALDGMLMAVPMATRNDVIEPGTPNALFPLMIPGGGETLQRQQYAVAPDGRFLVNTEQASNAPIMVLLNSNELSKR